MRRAIGHAPSEVLEITVAVRASLRVVRAPERDACVGTDQEHDVARLVEPEAEAVPPRLSRHVAARPHHLRNPVGRDDPAGEERAPERADVRHGRVDPAVAGAPHGQVKDVGPDDAVHREVPERRAPRELVGAEERGVDHPGRLGDAFVHELMEGNATRSLGDQREDDVRAVVVDELFARRKLGGVTVQDREEVLRLGELVDGNRHHVVGDVRDLLVEVVPDPRSVRQQVLDRHVVADQRQISAEHRPCRRRELEQPLLDEAHDRERRQALGCAGGAELRLECVRDAVAAMCEPVGARKLHVVTPVEANHPGEVVRLGDRIDRASQRLHGEDGIEPGDPTSSAQQGTSSAR